MIFFRNYLTAEIKMIIIHTQELQDFTVFDIHLEWEASENAGQEKYYYP